MAPSLSHTVFAGEFPWWHWDLYGHQHLSLPGTGKSCGVWVVGQELTPPLAPQPQSKCSPSSSLPCRERPLLWFAVLFPWSQRCLVSSGGPRQQEGLCRAGGDLLSSTEPVRYRSSLGAVPAPGPGSLFAPLPFAWLGKLGPHSPQSGSSSVHLP